MRLAVLTALVWPLLATEPGHVVSLTDIEHSLPKAKIVVVFDIDDTALFTSAGFQWGTRTYGPEIVSAGVPFREEDLKTEEDKRKYREFWTRFALEQDGSPDQARR